MVLGEKVHVAVKLTELIYRQGGIHVLVWQQAADDSDWPIGHTRSRRSLKRQRER